MSNSSQSRALPAAIVVALLIAIGVYFFTRPKEPATLTVAAPSASVAPPKATTAPGPVRSTAATTTASAAPSPNATKLLVGTLGPKGFAEVAELAKSKGYFDAEGLAVDIDHIKLASDIARDVSEHKYAFGITFDFAIAFEAVGKPGFVIIGEVAHADRPISVYARKDKGISTAADLKGKRIGVQPYPNAHYYLSNYLKHHGLRDKDVKVVEQAYEQVQSGLTRGEIDVVVDCIASVRGAGWNLMKTPGLELVDLSEPSLCPIRMGVIADEALVKSNPEAVAHFTRALAKSAAYLADQHDKAVDEIAQAMAIEGSKAHKLTDGLSYGFSLDPGLIAALDAERTWFQETGRDKSGTPAKALASLVYPNALRAALPDAVTFP